MFCNQVWTKNYDIIIHCPISEKKVYMMTSLRAQCTFVPFDLLLFRHCNWDKMQILLMVSSVGRDVKCVCDLIPCIK